MGLSFQNLQPVLCIRYFRKDTWRTGATVQSQKRKGLKKKLQSLSFIADIPNSPESRSSPTHGESNGFPSGPGPKLDKAHNNREGNNQGADSTLGNTQKGVLPRSVPEQKRSRNGRHGAPARLKPFRLKEKGSTESS